MKKIIEAAIAAKAAGYNHMSSVVKSVYSTTYYHIVEIDEIISAGKWIPCPKGQCGKWHGRIGTSTLPTNCINKSVAISRYCK